MSSASRIKGSRPIDEGLTRSVCRGGRRLALDLCDGAHDGPLVWHIQLPRAADPLGVGCVDAGAVRGVPITVAHDGVALSWQRVFRHWVILKPALIMEDLLPPMVQFMFPSLVDRGQFDSAIELDTRLDWIAAHDIGAFAAAAIADPERFHGHEIDLAAESVSLVEIAAKLTAATGKPVSAVTSSEAEMLARGEHGLSVRSQVWDSVESDKVDLDAVRSWGVPRTTLDEFIEQRRDQPVIG